MFKGLQIKVKTSQTCDTSQSKNNLSFVCVIINLFVCLDTVCYGWFFLPLKFIKLQLKILNCCCVLQYVRGSDPVLKLLDDNGNIAEELSILKWNTDSVEEFLSEKLDRI